jgi:PAS domain S-box-containing protein
MKVLHKQNDQEFFLNKSCIKKVFEKYSDGIIVVTDNGIIEFVNPAAEYILHRKADDLIGTSFGVPAMKNETTEIEVITDSDKRRIAEMKVIDSPLDNGTSYIITIRDITELKRTGKLLKGVFESIEEGFTVVDKNFRILSANSAYCKQIQLPVNDVINRPCYEVSHHLSKPCYEFGEECPIQHALTTGESKTSIHEHYDNRGSPMYVKIKAYPIRDMFGNISSAVEIITDITKTVKLEKALKEKLKELEESEEKFRSISIAAQDAIIMMDHRGNVTYWNSAAEKIFGYMSDEIIGKDLSKLIAPKRFYDKYLDAFDNHKNNNGESDRGKVIELTALKKDNTEIPIELSLSSVKIDDKWHTIGIIRDITDRKWLEEQLYQSQKMEAIGNLAGGVAHDFNNLLTVILGYSEISINYLTEDSTLQKNLKEIKKAAERGASLTRQLLTFSRKQVFQPRTFELNLAIRDMEKLLKRLIGEDIELVMNLDKSPKYIKADPGRIDQVIMNLAVNARDAMPKGGKLIIETTDFNLSGKYSLQIPIVQPGDYVLLSISDTGHGMTEETKTHIFEPFFTTKSKNKGTGLGLSTAYNIVKQSNGYISVNTQPDYGTTFIIYLPQIKETMVSQEGEKGKFDSYFGTETILLVEDEDVLRELASSILRQNGYNVLKASHGDDAVSISKQYKKDIHLLISDVIMPGLNGKQVAQCVSQLYPNMKIIYISGYTKDVIDNYGIFDLGTNFLPKPFTPFTLVRKVREVLDNISYTIAS